MRDGSRGALVIVGGGEDRTGDKTVLRRFVELAGGASAKVLVLGTATAVPDEVGPIYLDAFRDLGVAQVEFLPVSTRGEANSAATVAAVEQATGVYFTGGDQLRIASVVGGSHTDVALHSCHANGLVVGGTSAGAAMMSSTMIVRGADRVPTVHSVATGAGLGFVDGIVVDMHFAERGRLSRLLAVVAMYPHELGLGIDEDTAVVVQGSLFEVVGSGAVTVVDAGPVTSLHAPPEGEDGPIAVTGVLLHVLPAGYCFDLSTRLPVVTGVPSGAARRDEGEV